MSQTSKVTTEMTNTQAIRRAAERLGHKFLGEGTFDLYADKGIQGVGVKITDWHLPVIITPTGEVKCDVHNGRWGNLTDLDAFQQRYAAEAVHMYAEGQNMLCVEAEVTIDGEQYIELLVG